jgi:hypothetical protein
MTVGSEPVRVKSFPGGPLKLFDCFAWVVHAAMLPTALHGTLVVIFAETLCPGAMASPGVAARNWITFAEFETFQFVPWSDKTAWVVPAAGAPIVHAAGGLKFADPSVCVLAAVFVSVSVNCAAEEPACTLFGTIDVE